MSIERINQELHTKYPDFSIVVDSDGQFAFEKRVSLETGEFTNDVYLTSMNADHFMNVRVRDGEIIEVYPTMDPQYKGFEGVQRYTIHFVPLFDYSPYQAVDWKTNEATDLYAVKHGLDLSDSPIQVKGTVLEKSHRVILRFGRDCKINRVYGYTITDEDNLLARPEITCPFAQTLRKTLKCDYCCLYFEPDDLNNPREALVGYSPSNPVYKPFSLTIQL
jgi:hypothetical protein